MPLRNVHHPNTIVGDFCFLDAVRRDASDWHLSLNLKRIPKTEHFKERLKYYLSDHMRNKLMNILTDMMDCHRRQRIYMKGWTHFQIIIPYNLIHGGPAGV